jgi:hypothetical protein
VQTLNVLAIGAPGCDMTPIIINLSNYFWNKDQYDKLEENLYAFASYIPYKFKVTQQEFQYNIIIYEIRKIDDIKKIKELIIQKHLVFHGLMLFFDGTGFYLSQLLIKFYLREILSVTKFSSDLLIAFVFTKTVIVDLVNRKLIKNLFHYILNHDLYNRKISYISQYDNQEKQVTLSLYEDKINWYYFSHLEQLMVNLFEKRVLIIPMYERLSPVMLRYWIRNILGSILLNIYKLGPEDPKTFGLLRNLFKYKPTALENVSMYEHTQYSYIDWPEDVIPSIWEVPLNIEPLIKDLRKYLDMQLFNKAKAIWVAEDFESFFKKEVLSFGTDIYVISENNKENMLNLTRFFDNLIKTDLQKRYKGERKNELSLKVLGIDEFR